MTVPLQPQTLFFPLVHVLIFEAFQTLQFLLLLVVTLDFPAPVFFFFFFFCPESTVLSTQPHNPCWSKKKQVGELDGLPSEVTAVWMKKPKVSAEEQDVLVSLSHRQPHIAASIAVHSCYIYRSQIKSSKGQFTFSTAPKTTYRACSWFILYSQSLPSCVDHNEIVTKSHHRNEVDECTI